MSNFRYYKLEGKTQKKTLAGISLGWKYGGAMGPICRLGCIFRFHVGYIRWQNSLLRALEANRWQIRGAWQNQSPLALLLFLFLLFKIIFFPMTLGGYYMKNWKTRWVFWKKTLVWRKISNLIMCPLDALELFYQCFTTVLLFDRSWMYFVPIRT